MLRRARAVGIGDRRFHYKKTSQQEYRPQSPQSRHLKLDHAMICGEYCSCTESKALHAARDTLQIYKSQACRKQRLSPSGSSFLLRRGHRRISLPGGLQSHLLPSMDPECSYLLHLFRLHSKSLHSMADCKWKGGLLGLIHPSRNLTTSFFCPIDTT